MLYLLIFLFGPAAAQASDQAKEKRWREQISGNLFSGEVRDLKAGDADFMAIYTEAEQGPTGRWAILVHGIGVHPDWPDIIHPLRTGLPEHGWSTLSIQMPVLANDAPLKDYLPLFDESGPRLKAAVDYARKQGAKTLVIIAHSLGASMAARYVADSPDGVDGLVLIGMAEIDLDEKMNGVLALEKIKMPVFDLSGSRDLAIVLNARAARAKAARKAGNEDFRQLQVEGADHFFVGVEDELVRRTYGWLKSHYEKTKGK